MTGSRPFLVAGLAALTACGLATPTQAQASLQPAAAPFIRGAQGDTIPFPFSTGMAPPRTVGERVGNGVLGGLVGTAVGVGVCTLMSVVFFEGSGCTTKGNVAFGAAGFALGFGVGFLL